MKMVVLTIYYAHKHLSIYVCLIKACMSHKHEQTKTTIY